MPRAITVNLTDEGVEKNISSILKDMGSIRNETVQNEKISDEQKDEYLHLTHRLASCIKGLATPQIIEGMDKLGKYADKNKELISYDPLQREYWKGKNPDFVGTLDDLTARLFGDDFNSTDQGHHIVQTIKYFGSIGEEEKKQIALLDAIVPFSSPNLKNDNLLKRAMSSIFGYSFKIDKADGLTARIEGSEEFLPEMLNEAKRRGFRKAQMDMHASDFKSRKGDFPDAAIIDGKGQRGSGELLRHFIARTIQCTKPISYYLIGNMPLGMQKTIADYTRIDNDPRGNNFDMDKRYGKKDEGTPLSTAQGYSTSMNILAGVGLGITALASKSIPNAYAIPAFAYALIEGFSRICSYNDHDENMHLGSILSLPFLPLWPVFRRLNEDRKMKGDLCTVEFNLCGKGEKGSSTIEDAVVREIRGENYKGKLENLVGKKVRIYPADGKYYACGGGTESVPAGSEGIIDSTDYGETLHVKLSNAKGWNVKLREIIYEEPPKAVPQRKRNATDEDSEPAKEESAENYFNYFSEIAESKLPEETKFGKLLNSSLTRKYCELENGLIDRENQAITYSKMQEIGDYKKQTFLVFHPDRRFVLSRIAKDELKDNLVSLTQKIETEEDARNLVNGLHKNSAYVHLSYIKDGQKVADIK